MSIADRTGARRTGFSSPFAVAIPPECAGWEQLYADHALDITGPLPTNTDGGLIANGEPIGASGLRQVYELVTQLKGRAGDRQVQGDPQVGYAQVYGAPGTAAVTILSK